MRLLVKVVMFCIDALKRILSLLSHDADEASRRVEKCGGGGQANVIACPSALLTASSLAAFTSLHNHRHTLLYYRMYSS
jgi:hypothetical protein